MAKFYFDMYNDLTSTGDYLTYTTGEFGAGIASVPQDLAGGLGTIIGDIATGGKYSDSYPVLNKYLEQHPELLHRLVVPDHFIKAELSRATGISEKIVGAYIASGASSNMRSIIDKDFGKDLDETYKNKVGNWAYTIGQQIPGLLLTMGASNAAEGGGLIGSLLEGKGILTALKTALKGNLATTLIGATAAVNRYTELATENGYNPKNFLNAAGTGFIEYFTEGLFGFSDAASYKNIFKSVTGNTAATVMKGLFNWLEGGFEEGLENAVNVPLEGLLDKFTTDRNIPITGDGGIFDWNAMLEQGLNGMATGLIMGGVSAVSTVYSAVSESGDIQTAIKALDNIAQTTLPEDLRPDSIDVLKAKMEDVEIYAAEMISALEEYSQRTDEINAAADGTENLQNTPVDADPLMQAALEKVQTEDSFDGTPEVYAPKEYEKALPTIIDRSGNEAVALGVEQGDGGQMALRLSDGTVQNISDVTFADPR
ncbi:MAG: hypothetical protein ACYCX2_12040, partial [Christensenellales bacterium]